MVQMFNIENYFSIIEWISMDAMHNIKYNIYREIYRYYINVCMVKADLINSWNFFPAKYANFFCIKAFVNISLYLE